jgi:tetratricopeptide (TPR) repeat protein
VKLFKKFINLPRIIKAVFALNKALSLHVAGKNKEALTQLEKHKEILKDKSISYYLTRGRIQIDSDPDYRKAIEDFSQGISIINSKRKMKPNKREYLLAWTKYCIAWCYFELGEKDTAEHWRSESEKHYFDIENVPQITKSEFPMKW